MSNGKGTQQTARSAVAGASVSDTAIVRDDHTDVVLPSGAAEMFSKAGTGEINEFMADGDADFAPQIKSMEENDRVRGVLEGYGHPTEFMQKNQGTGVEETRVVNTWIIRSLKSSARVSILSSIQLDAKLPPFIGGEVDIIRGKDIKTRSGFRVADYMVKGKKVTGKVRSWSTTSLPRTIEATVNQLPERASGPGEPPVGHEDAVA